MTGVLAQALLNGVASGAIYGLIALGLSLQFGVMKIINFAHGSFLMVAMYVSLWCGRHFGLHPITVIPFAACALYLIGWLTQRWLLEDIYRKEATREPMGVLIFTTGLWIFLDNLFLFIAGPDYQVIKSDWTDMTISAGPLVLSYPQAAGLLVSCVTTAALVLFLRGTRLGRTIRATGQDREAASVLGIDSARIYQISFAIGLAVLGVAGALLLPMYPVNPFVGEVFGLRAFVIVVLGGIGSIGGAFWGGIVVGVLESIGGQFMPATFSEALIFTIFLGVLYFRPTGLFGLERE